MAKKTKDLKYYEAIGRRKEAVACVRMYIPVKDKQASIKTPGNKESEVKIKAGDIYINAKPIEKLFPAEYEKASYLLPLKLTDNVGRFAISIFVNGGGRHSQLEAIVHGISRALNKADREGFRTLLKKQGLLTRDPRVRERRKVGTGGKARRAKQSPKR
jgi:small subunit ribosomal protein S9